MKRVNTDALERTWFTKCALEEVQKGREGLPV